MRSRKYFVLFSLLTVLASDCGKKSEGNSSLDSMIGVMAISSPTAHTTDATASLWSHSKGTLFGMLSFSGLRTLFVNLGLTSKKSHASTNDIEDLATAREVIEEILAENSVTNCLAEAFIFTPQLPSVSCYGPQINYENHPHDDTTDGQFPSGDAGLWTATESAVEACASAKMNSVMKNVGDIVNGGLKTLAALICVAKVSGMELPGIGDPAIDLTTILNANVSGGSFTTASLSQVATRAGAEKTFQMIIDGTKNAKKIELNLTHSPTNADNTTFMGHLHGKLGYGATTTALSLTYNQSTTKLDAVLKTGDLSAASDAAFDGSNEVNYSAATFIGHSVYYNLISVDVNNGLGTAYSAWQANPNDSNTRVFQAETTSASPADTGVAYFGFGPQITAGSGLGSITKMICNWSGPGNSHTGVTKAQKQTMTRNGSGIFIPSTNNITYALTNDCDYTDGGPHSFGIGVQPAAATAIGTNITNDLVNIAEISSNITTLTEPTY